MSKKTPSLQTTKIIGQLVHHRLNDTSFTQLVLKETLATKKSITTKHYTIERKDPKTFVEVIFGFGSASTARGAVTAFFDFCANRNTTFQQQVTFGYADEAVLEFCTNEMFDELEALHQKNVTAKSNG